MDSIRTALPLAPCPSTDQSDQSPHTLLTPTGRRFGALTGVLWRTLRGALQGMRGAPQLASVCMAQARALEDMTATVHVLKACACTLAFRGRGVRASVPHGGTTSTASKQRACACVAHTHIQPFAHTRASPRHPHPPACPTGCLGGCAQPVPRASAGSPFRGATPLGSPHATNVPYSTEQPNKLDRIGAFESWLQGPGPPPRWQNPSRVTTACSPVPHAKRCIPPTFIVVPEPPGKAAAASRCCGRPVPLRRRQCLKLLAWQVASNRRLLPAPASASYCC